MVTPEYRATVAKRHIQEMATRHNKLIKQSIEHTRVYSPDTSITGSLEIKEPKIILDDIDTVSAIFKYHTDKTAALNFASYKVPGGKYLEGAMAQEEALCSKSNLYNILSSFDSYYEWNNKNKNKALYTNRALYIPNVIFEDTRQIQLCDVISCAAPNWRAAHMYGMADKDMNTKALLSRIKFILEIAREQEVNTLILGAFGCGVFGQPPKLVATIFEAYLDDHLKCFDTVVFAIPDKESKNYQAFKEVLFNNSHKEPTSLF